LYYFKYLYSFEVAATDFTTDIAVTHHILAHPVKNSFPVLNIFTR